MNIDNRNLILRMLADAASSGRWSEIPEIIDSLPKGTRFRITFDLIRDVPDTAPPAAPALDTPEMRSKPGEHGGKDRLYRSREELGLPDLPPNYSRR
jgi:hypothetical protein